MCSNGDIKGLVWRHADGCVGLVLVVQAIRRHSSINIYASLDDIELTVPLNLYVQLLRSYEIASEDIRHSRVLSQPNILLSGVSRQQGWLQKECDFLVRLKPYNSYRNAHSDIFHSLMVTAQHPIVACHVQGLTLTCEPGVLTALMGGSGAGKTTLMDCIAGRKTQGLITGDILVNGTRSEQHVSECCKCWERRGQTCQ